MAKWMLIDLSVFACVLTLTGILIPQILLIAFRKNLFDTPDPRKIHKTEVPRLGGIAFCPAILFALLLLFGMGVILNDNSLELQLQDNLLPFCFTGCGVILLYLTGMADDLVGVRYSAKFVMQALAAALVIVAGVRLGNLHGFLGITELPIAVSVLVTALLIVFIINAINLIDGIDGLASGLSAIACAFYTFVFLHSNLYIYSALAVAMLGALVPFFMFNVFGNAKKHKKIFMGDTGALTIGFFLSVMSIEICSIEWVESKANPAVIAFAPLLIPGMDVVRVYIHRLKSGKNPFLPDKTHIHHKLLALGMSQRKAMMTIIASSVVLIALNYVLSAHIGITVLFLSDLALWIVINTILTRSIYARERKLTVKLYE